MTYEEKERGSEQDWRKTGGISNNEDPRGIFGPEGAPSTEMTARDYRPEPDQRTMPPSRQPGSRGGRISG